MKKISLIAIFFFSLTALSAQTKIVIGIGYKKMSTDCGQFTEAAYWKAKHSSVDSYSKLKDEINKYFSDMNISSSNVIFTSSDKPYACVISYKKKWSDNCNANQFACGYGNSNTDALNAAVREMHLYTNNDTYSVEQYIEAN